MCFPITDLSKSKFEQRHDPQFRMRWFMFDSGSNKKELPGRHRFGSYRNIFYAKWEQFIHIYIYKIWMMDSQKKSLMRCGGSFSTWFKAPLMCVCVCVCTPQGVLIGLGQNTTTFVRWVYKWIDGLKVPGHRNIGVIPYKKKGRRNGFLGIMMWHFASDFMICWCSDFGQFHDHVLFLQEIDDIWSHENCTCNGCTPQKLCPWKGRKTWKNCFPT